MCVCVFVWGDVASLLQLRLCGIVHVHGQYGGNGSAVGFCFSRANFARILLHIKYQRSICILKYEVLINAIHIHIARVAGWGLPGCFLAAVCLCVRMRMSAHPHS